MEYIHANESLDWLIKQPRCFLEVFKPMFINSIVIDWTRNTIEQLSTWISRFKDHVDKIQRHCCVFLLTTCPQCHQVIVSENLQGHEHSIQYSLQKEIVQQKRSCTWSSMWPLFCTSCAYTLWILQTRCPGYKSGVLMTNIGLSLPQDFFMEVTLDSWKHNLQNTSWCESRFIPYLMLIFCIAVTISSRR